MKLKRHPYCFAIDCFPRSGSNYTSHVAAASTTDRVTYTITPTATQSFNVFARWVAQASNASNATYTIAPNTAGSTPLVVTVNQRQDGGTWNYLGTVNLNTANQMTVTLSGQGNGIVMADAVKIVPNTTSATQASAFNIYTDHLNTPREIRNHANQLRWTWYPEVSGAFGAGLPNENPNTPALGVFTYNLRFPGQLYDPTSQLSYNYYRDYSSRTGRYIESDPIGLEGGINTYGYVNGNPLSYVDPRGLVQVNLFDPNGELDPDVGQKLNDAVATYADNPDICLVYAHGNPTEVIDDREGIAKRKRLDAKQLEKVLRAAGCTPEMPVVLNACNAGKGKNPVGKNLADYFTGGVSAPNRQIWYNKANQPNFIESLFGAKPITGPTQIYGKDGKGKQNLNDPGKMRNF